MFGLDFFYSVDFLLLNLILFSNWSMDSIEHKYGASIYYQWEWLRETKFFGYREFWKHDWRRKWVGGDPSNGRKRKWGIVIPVFFLDGWHFWKGVMLLSVFGLLAANFTEFLVGWLWWGFVWWLLWDRYYDD